jgi:hypothetical protein
VIIHTKIQGGVRMNLTPTARWAGLEANAALLGSAALGL